MNEVLKMQLNYSLGVSGAGKLGIFHKISFTCSSSAKSGSVGMLFGSALKK